jgi:hypothetical protein
MKKKEHMYLAQVADTQSSLFEERDLHLFRLRLKRNFQTLWPLVLDLLENKVFDNKSFELFTESLDSLIALGLFQTAYETYLNLLHDLPYEFVEQMGYYTKIFEDLSQQDLIE